MRHQISTKFYLLILSLISYQVVWSQCQNSNLFPTTTVTPSTYNNEVIVTNKQSTGQYYIISNLIPGQTYRFSSSETNDFITVRTNDLSTVLAYGVIPVDFSPKAGQETVTVHINLSNPKCGTEVGARMTTVTCITCPPVPPRVGINTTVPRATLDIGGDVIIGNDNNPAMEGMIRWDNTAKDLEVFDGIKWLSLTQTNDSWGNVSEVVTERNFLNGDDGAGAYGYSIALSDDLVIVGAPSEDITYTDQGAAYILRRIGRDYYQEAKLISPDPDLNDLFGYSVSISGNYAIVGVPYKSVGINTNQGAAYVFYYNGSSWVLDQTINALDGSANDLFGWSVEVYNEEIFIGAPSDDIDLVEDIGSVYVYQKPLSDWDLEQKIYISTAASGTALGSSLSVHDTQLAIGAVGDDPLGGGVAIYTKSAGSWSFSAGISPSDDGRNFGKSCDIYNNWLIVGSPGYVPIIGSPYAGAAYIFENNLGSWSEMIKIGSPLEDYDQFGIDVSINDQYAIIGSATNATSPSLPTAAYLYQNNASSWEFDTKLVSTELVDRIGMGGSVALDGSHAVIGNASPGKIFFYYKIN